MCGCCGCKRLIDWTVWFKAWLAHLLLLLLLLRLRLRRRFLCSLCLAASAADAAVGAILAAVAGRMWILLLSVDWLALDRSIDSLESWIGNARGWLAIELIECGLWWID